MANSNQMVDVFLNSKVHEFLRSRQIYEKGHECSLTAMGDHKGKWFVSDADYPQFLDILHDHLVVRRLRPMNLVEQRKPDGITPLTIDLDFHYPVEKALTRAFTQDMIQAFINEILNVLKEYFEMKGRIRFFVTLRPQPYLERKNKKEIKDGIHILCPDFTLNAELQAFVRHKVLEADAVTKSFKETGYINKDDNVFDKMMVGPKANGWMFYGESKADIPPYELKYIFKYVPTSGRFSQESIENYAARDILQTLSIRYNLAAPLLVREALKESVYKQIAEWAKPKVVAPAAAGENELVDANPGLWEPYMHDIKPESELDLIRNLTKECLSANRADEYDTWIKVGWCLRNIDTSDEMFLTWMEFSKKSVKFAGNDIAQLRRQWANGSMKRDNSSSKLTAGSLHFWARQDNPEQYKKIMGDNIINYIRKVGSTFKGGTHHHVASIMKKLFHERYICSIDNRSTEWFEFREHVWVHIPQGMKLKEHIHNDVATLVSEARAAVRSMSATCKNEEEYKRMNEDLAKLLDFEKNLYSANFKDSIMKECVQLFYNEQFIKLLNQDPYIIGCANGVLHLRHILTDDKGKLIKYQPTLMPGRPTDYVSLQLGVTPDGRDPIEYVPYNAADPVQGEIMDFFRKLFPADDLREYVLTIAAGCLEGANKEQCFYIMTGSGGNGKSKFTDLMSSVFGQYAGSLSTTALTRKRPESGAANPDIMGIKACRFIDMKEPDENEPINSARMKQFSGEDLVEARGLFKDQERFKIMGKIFMACNRMPPIHSMDGGTWRRIRVIPFDSRFVNPSETPVDLTNHIYPRDDMMDEKLKQWRIPFFSLLVHYYETRYCPNGVKKIPEVVMQASNNYKNSHDSFGKFLAARVRRVPGYDEPPMFPKLWAVYRNWQLEENSSGKKLTQNEFRIRLNETFQVPSDGKTYKHIRIFGSDEDAEEYDKELEKIEEEGEAEDEAEA